MLPITLTVFAQMIGEGLALTSLPLHMKSLGASTVMSGVAVSGFSLSSLIFTPVVVRISNRVGRFKVLRACLLGCALAQLLIVQASTPLALAIEHAHSNPTGFPAGLIRAPPPVVIVRRSTMEYPRLQASTPAGVVFGRFVCGIFAASVPVAQAAVTDLVSPAQSALALSRVSAVSQLGVVVGPALGALAIAILNGLGGPAGQSAPLGSGPARPVCLFRARRLALGSSAPPRWLPATGRPMGAQPPPRGLKRAASKVADLSAFGLDPLA